MQKNVPNWAVGGLLLAFSIASIIFFKAYNSARSSFSAESSCQPASGNLYTGVQLYLDGQCQNSLATVLGGSDQYQGFDGKPQRAVKIRYPNGNDEWKLRDDLIGRTFIKTDDPAIAAQQWQELKQ